MSLNTNFDEVAELKKDELKVTGTTDPAPAGWELLSRHFIVTQGAVNVPRQATEGQSWAASRRIPPDRFSNGAALAIGTETYYYDVGDDEKPPSFITISWSQIIQIQTRP